MDPAKPTSSWNEIWKVGDVLDTSVYRPSPIFSNAFFYWVLFIVFSTVLWHLFLIDKHLSADGAGCFLVILEHKEFTTFAWSRSHAWYLMEWPLLLGVQAGIRNLSDLSKLFALGIYFSYLLTFALCHYALRGQNKTLLAFPLLSMVAVNLPADYLLSGESQAMALFTWPILFMCLRRTTYTWLDGTVLCLELFLYTRMYETAILAGSLFGLLLLVRLYIYWNAPRERIFIFIAGTLCILTITIGTWAVVFPRDLDNRSSFAAALLSTFRLQSVYFSCIFSFFLFLGILCKSRLLLIVSLLPILGYLRYLLLADSGPYAGPSFGARTLASTFLHVLLLFSLIVWITKYRWSRATGSLVVGYFLIMLTGSLCFSKDWHDFKNQFKALLDSRPGFIAIEDYPLSRSRCLWGWNNPHLSLCWSNLPVKSIILNPPDNSIIFFDPMKERVLPDFIEYDECSLVVPIAKNDNKATR